MVVWGCGKGRVMLSMVEVGMICDQVIGIVFVSEATCCESDAPLFFA